MALPFASKKSGDMVVALDYLSDRITAEDAIQKLNGFVRDKRRSGFIRKVRIPCTRSEGMLEGRRFGAAVGSRAKLVKVPKSSQKAIPRDWAVRHASVRELQAKYGYSERVVRRILRDRG